MTDTDDRASGQNVGEQSPARRRPFLGRAPRADDAGRDTRGRRGPRGSRRHTSQAGPDVEAQDDPRDLGRARVAELVGVSEGTLRRWVGLGLVPLEDGAWTAASLNHARVVQRLRSKGRSLSDIALVAERNGSVLDYLGGLLAPATRHVTPEEVAERTGLEPALVRRVGEAFGFSAQSVERIAADDVRLFEHVATALDAGFPLVALLQLARIYGQALGRVADAEVRMFRLYVRDPLIRENASALEAAEAVAELASHVMPLADRLIEDVHRRSLHWFIEQDAVSLVEQALDEDALLGLGRLRVTIAFADLAGFTRLTEEQGDEEAVDAVERFVDAVDASLPDDARILKTIGDEVMVIADAAAGLVDWAVEFQARQPAGPRTRIGIHEGEVLFRDGDYFGREVNRAARVVARAGPGEVLVTDAIAAHPVRQVAYDPIGDVRLKGFKAPTALYVARRRAGSGPA
ncbi:adenylate/guanylate cyclase domain-containing protein [Patulibacter sp.]|uniref:adenylate/guanylate cyclase domain-containing protein n=1 Tax=Patulibacter sp. TaxID=1912859 RepID=UPI00271FF7EC|nr:adenylate/guanylate cyclase domain-containing protein [Patulibacter sp.]MDO9410713.1 adenylate/guanylate cyclase domain-containing protein [Patulibacter sp.]